MDDFELDPDDNFIGLYGRELGIDEWHATYLADLKREKIRRSKNQKRGLTQRIVDRARATDKEEFLPHTIKGFGLRIRTSGHKTYVLNYKINGKFKRLKIGDAVEMTFEEAETQAYQLKADIRDGHDPQGQRQINKNFTLDDFFHSYIKNHVRPHLSKSWGREIERLFANFIQGNLGAKPVADITRQDLMQCAQRGSTDNVRQKIRIVLSGLYTWGTAMGDVDNNILAGSYKFPVSKPRDRILTDHELWAVWTNSYKLNPPWDEFFRFLILTGQRRSEVAKLHWREIDIENQVWRIPAERMKNRQEHIVPLTAAMCEILSNTPNQKGFVFQSPRVASQPVSGFSKAMLQLKSKANFTDWRNHDLRRTVSTTMAKLGIAPHIIEAVLSHQSGTISGVARVYNRHTYIDEKRDALARWNDYVLKVAEMNFEPITELGDAIVL